LTHTEGGTKIRFKEIFNFKNGVQISDDIRVCLPIRSDGTIYTRLRNNVMKIQYDHGIEVWKGFVFDSYASLNFTKDNA
jgi:outer membrane protein assembly factor BamB